MRIAVIPARGGSKRIKGKNIKKFLGKPIISYSIRAAINSKEFDKVFVSTDDPKTAKIAMDYGALVPFLRDPKSSDDHATLHDVICDFLGKFPTGYHVDKIALILATAPMLNVNSISLAMSALDKPSYDSAVTVSRFEVNPTKALTISDSGVIIKEGGAKIIHRSQDLEEFYHDAGQIYTFYQHDVLKRNTLTGPKCKAIILPRLQCQDIDTLEDWFLAEAKYKLMRKQ